MLFGENIPYSIVSLKEAEDDGFLLNKFDCDNKAINDFLVKDSRVDESTSTYLFVNKNDKSLIGFVSIQCSGIVTTDENDKSWRITYPAIQIYNFAVDKKYQRLPYRKNIKHDYFSDRLFADVIRMCQEIAENTIAADYVTAYAVPDKEHFYRRNNFSHFSEYEINEDPDQNNNHRVVPDQWEYIEECILMYLKLH